MKVVWSLFLVVNLCASRAVAEDSAADIWKSDAQATKDTQNDHAGDVVATVEDIDTTDADDDQGNTEDDVD